MKSITNALVSKREIAEACDVNISTINRWMKDGKIPYLKVGKRVLFDAAKVISHLQSNFTVINDNLPTERKQDTAMNAANGN